MQNIGCEFSGVYEYNKITSNGGKQFYTGRLNRDNGESELWSKDWTPFIPARENITIEKLRLKNDMRDYNGLTELQKYNLKCIRDAGGIGICVYPSGWGQFLQLLDDIQAGRAIDINDDNYIMR